MNANRWKKAMLTTLGLALAVPWPVFANLPMPPVERRVAGWVERVMLDPARALVLEAKLDTGADTSSLDARHIRRIRRGDDLFIGFTVRDPVTGEDMELVKPYVRRARIKRHGGTYQQRYVVRMTVCIADIARSIEINLIDRERFDYPMLLGRSALEGLVVVDPKLSHAHPPVCWNQSHTTEADTAVTEK